MKKLKQGFAWETTHWHAVACPGNTSESGSVTARAFSPGDNTGSLQARQCHRSARSREPTRHASYMHYSAGVINLSPCDVFTSRSRTAKRCAHPEFRRLTQTALEHSEHLGWAEIRHPFHPLRGQRFPVLKKRRIAGKDTLILRGLDCGTFSVAREWTDWADPSSGDSLKLPLRRLDAESLLALVTLLEQLPQRSTEKG